MIIVAISVKGMPRICENSSMFDVSFLQKNNIFCVLHLALWVWFGTKLWYGEMGMSAWNGNVTAQTFGNRKTWHYKIRIYNLGDMETWCHKKE